MTLPATIDACSAGDLAEWSRMRASLWPDLDAEGHRIEAEEMLGASERFAAFIARDAHGVPLGIAEGSLRVDYVNGTSTSPVGFLEGLYFRDNARQRGVARWLVAAIEDWAAARGCVELASDADLGNSVSHLTHAALGFAETERVVCFVKPIGGPSAR